MIPEPTPSCSCEVGEFGSMPFVKIRTTDGPAFFPRLATPMASLPKRFPDRVDVGCDHRRPFVDEA